MFFLLHCGWTSWQKSKVALRTVAAAHGLSCCHGWRLRLPAPQLCDSLRRTGLRSWKITRYHWDQHIICVEVSVIAFAMSWRFGWPFRLLCLAATGASREELQRDSELLLSHRSVSDASRALAGGGVGLLNSCCSCIADCRNLWYSDYIQPSSGIHPRQFTENY